MIDSSLLPKAYTEVIEILKYITKDDYNKIPKEIIENMESQRDTKYVFYVDNIDNFMEQKMLPETEVILAVLFRDYWATEEQRRKIILKERYY